MFFDEVFARNEAFRRGRPPRPLPPVQIKQLAVVSCYDPRLDELIRPSLGLATGEAILVRSAGARIAPTGDPMRSLALAVFLFDVREVLVLGHKACRMAQFDGLQFANAFRGRGVARDAFGSDDLRTWAGAIASPEQGVRDGVAVVRAAPFLPRDLAVSGWVLNEETGVVDLVVRPDQEVRAAAVSSEVGPGEPAPPVEPSRAVPQQRATRPAHASTSPAPPGAAVPPPIPGGAAQPTSRSSPVQDPLVGGIESVQQFLSEIERLSVWRGALRQLRSDLARETHPVGRLRLVEAFMRRAAADAQGAREAFHRLRDAAASGRGPLTTDDVVSLFQEERR